MKNLLQTIRATFLLILLLGSGLTVAAYDFASGGIYYNITSSTNMTAAVTYYSKTDNTYSGTITIPEKVTHDGKTYYVTAIGEYAFIGCTGLKKVNYSQRITTINNYAFQGCNGITSFVIPPNITSIGNSVFKGCMGITGVTIEESEETLSLGCNSNDSRGLFYDCPLVSVFIGRPLSYDTSYSRGYSPFANNRTLVKAHFGNPVKSIQSYLLLGCSSLKTLVYNSQCRPTSIGDNAFWGCTALTESDIHYPETIKTIGTGAFASCTSITSYTIPNHVTTIGNSVFKDCTRLANVVIKPSVSSIGNDSFKGCTALTGVTIEESEETLSLGCNSNDGRGLFYDCPLVSVFIGRPLSYDTSYSRGYSPFANNRTLVKAHFGNPVKSIQSYLLLGCSSLKTLVYNSQCRPTSIGDNAFWGCTALTESDIHYPETIKTIGTGAFASCTSITSYTIPNHVTTIGNSVFKDCTRLANVVIKPSVSSIGNDSFKGCTALTGVTIEESEETLSLGCNSNDGRGLFYDCPLVSVFIGRPLSYDTSYSRGYSPFANNRTLVKAHFGNPVKSIQSYLLLGCSSLKTLVYNSQCRPTSIGDNAFWGCTALTESDIHYPETIKTIGTGAFASCTSITSYTIPNHVTTIGNSVFKDCTRLANVVIKPSVSSIGNDSFKGCTALTGVTIEESEETLSLGCNSNDGRGLFYDCPLVSVFIGRPLSYDTSYSRGYSPFANNTSLVKARLGKRMTSIPNYLFYGCVYLDEVTSCAVTPPSANANCFTNYEARLYVPKNSVTAYRNADVWKSFSYITGVDVGDDDEPVVPGWVVGDVDGNGKVNIDDVTALIQLLLTGHL